MTRHRILAALAGLGLVVVGAVGGYTIAAPSITDIRNACVADQIVPAGLPPGVTPGPHGADIGPLVRPKSLDEQPLEEQP